MADNATRWWERLFKADLAWGWAGPLLVKLVPLVIGGVAAYLAALEHQPLSRVFLFAVFGMAGGLSVVAGVLVVVRQVGTYGIRSLWRRQHGPSAAARAQRKRIRIQTRDYLRQLYDETGRHAIGGLMVQINAVSARMRANTNDSAMVLAGRLLSEPAKNANSAVHPMLNARDSIETDRHLDAYLDAWGELFIRYQAAVSWLNEAHRAAGIMPWSIKYVHYDYPKWREYDARFIEAMKTLEHMDGCAGIVAFLKDAGWGDANRPDRPNGETGQAALEND